MLHIRKEQIDLILVEDEDEFIDFLLEHIGEQHSDTLDRIPTEDARAMMATGLKRGRSHGFYTAKDLAAFVALMFEIAPNFDTQPDLRAVLQDERIPVEERLDHLFDESLKEAWEQAEDAYDATAWFPELSEADEE